MDIIERMSMSVGAQPVNINNYNASIKSLLNVNNAKYKAYEESCLTSTTPNKPNVQVILEEVLQLQPKLNSEGRIDTT